MEFFNSLLGIAVGVIAVFYILASFLLGWFPALESWRYWIAAALALLGIAGWFHGRHIARRRAAPSPEAAQEVWPLSDRRYLGIMLTVLGIISPFIHPHMFRKEVKQLPPPPATTRVVPKPEPVVIKESPPPPAPVKFPQPRHQTRTAPRTASRRSEFRDSKPPLPS